MINIGSKLIKFLVGASLGVAAEKLLSWWFQPGSTVVGTGAQIFVMANMMVDQYGANGAIAAAHEMYAMKLLPHEHCLVVYLVALSRSEHALGFSPTKTASVANDNGKAVLVNPDNWVNPADASTGFTAQLMLF